MGRHAAAVLGTNKRQREASAKPSSRRANSDYGKGRHQRNYAPDARRASGASGTRAIGTVLAMKPPPRTRA